MISNICSPSAQHSLSRPSLRWHKRPLRVGDEEDCIAMVMVLSTTGREGVKERLLIGQQQTESNTAFHTRPRVLTLLLP
ncbi:uncharacterized [Tachysurus ichikawai]